MIQRTWWPRLNRNAQLAKGLVFAGLGGGASTLQYADASVHGTHGTLTGYTVAGQTPTEMWYFSPILARMALKAGGAGDTSVATSLNISTLGAEFSISGWFLTRAASYDSQSVLTTPATATYSVLGLKSGPTTYARFQKQVSWSVVELIGGTAITAGTWRHLCGVSDASGVCRLYLNGIEDADTQTKAGAVNGVISLATGAKYRGAEYADILVHNRTLSPAEIQQLADPSNVMLSGLILPPRRTVWPAAVAGGTASASPSESISESPSTSPSPSESISESPSESISGSPSESISASPSESASGSPSESISESPSESISESPSESPSESVSESPSESASASPSPSESPSESISESPSESASESPSSSACASIDGTSCWGHATGVEEDNTFTFATNWEGTGDIIGEGDAEYMLLAYGESMTLLDIIHTGEMAVTIQDGKYSVNSGATVFYRHAATCAGVESAEWSNYLGQFESLGYVQVKVENTQE
jgi:hypothetical protein